MVGSIVDHCTYANHRESKLCPLLDGVLESFITGGNVLCWNDTALDLIDELVVLRILTLFDRLNVPCDSCILTRTTGLLLVSIVEIGTLADRFTIRDLWSIGLYRRLVFSAHSLNIDFEVQFTHSLN